MDRTTHNPQAPLPALEKTPLQTQQMPPHFVPFAPPALLQQQMQPPVEDNVSFSKPWHMAKIVLGTASILSSIVIWGLSIAIIARYSGATYDSFQVVFEVSFSLAAAGLAIVWQAAEFITIWASAKHRGIHPGANVALHLIIWLISALGVGFLATFVAFDVERLSRISSSSSSSYHYYDDYYYDKPSLSRLLKLEEATLAFLSILLLLHFMLFVRACIETSQYNSRTISRTVYVHVPMPMPGAASQGPYAYYGYPAVPGQQPQPVPVPQFQPQSTAQGAPVEPTQAHLYGYYAPATAPGPAWPSGGQEAPRTATLPGPSTSEANRGVPPAGTVSPATTDSHK